jgi:hypothetical protein
MVSKYKESEQFWAKYITQPARFTSGGTTDTSARSLPFIKRNVAASILVNAHGS